jgi:glucose/arabinose dehydrogenase
MGDRHHRIRRSFGLIARATLVAALVPVMGVLQTAPSQAGTNYKLVRKMSGLDQPVYMTVPPGEKHKYFIVLKPGEIVIADDWNLRSTPFLDMTSIVSSDGERGLLSMAFDPDYATNRRFYVYYTNLSGNIVIARYLRDPSNENLADPNSRVTLTTVDHPTWDNHNGGMMQFDPIAAQSGTSMLYFATGDGGSGGDPNNNSQNLSSGLGKMFRIDVNDANFTREMFAYGLRNPWRWSFDKVNGNIRIGDVGQNEWEELDLIKQGTAPGVNLGWRKYEGTHLYHDQTIDESRLIWPFEEYAHSGGNCSVTGGYTYRGTIDSLYGYYLYADLCTGNIWRRKPGHNVKMDISGTVNNIVSFAEGDGGGLYVISIDGEVWKLNKA